MSAPEVDIVIAGGCAGAPGDHCTGPDADGDCPRVAVGERVVCAGRRLRAVRGLPIDGWDIEVAEEAAGYPLAWLLARLSTAP